MLVSQLEGQHLDYHVARADGYTLAPAYPGAKVLERQGIEIAPYSTEWQFGGPIIEREIIQLMHSHQPKMDNQMWSAKQLKYGRGPPLRGSTPLIAAMRAWVVRKFGKEVEISKSEQDLNKALEDIGNLTEDQREVMNNASTFKK